MPQAEERLRQIFMQGDDTGIDAACRVLSKYGYEMKQGMLFIPRGTQLAPDAVDALQFLQDEWDYGWEYVDA